MLKKFANICGYEGHISQRYSICPKKLMYFFYDSRTHMKCVRFRTKGKRDLLYSYGLSLTYGYLISPMKMRSP